MHLESIFPADEIPRRTRLAPPGAGLPFLELMVARFLFRRRVNHGGPASFTAKFVAERARIGGLVRNQDAAT